MRLTHQRCALIHSLGIVLRRPWHKRHVCIPEAEVKKWQQQNPQKEEPQLLRRPRCASGLDTFVGPAATFASAGASTEAKGESKSVGSSGDDTAAAASSASITVGAAAGEVKRRSQSSSSAAAASAGSLSASTAGSAADEKQPAAAAEAEEEEAEYTLRWAGMSVAEVLAADRAAAIAAFDD